MTKQFPQGCSDGEELRDNDVVGLYKPDDTPSVVDGSLNKKITLLKLRQWLETVITALSSLTLSGLFTVSASGITSSETTIGLNKKTTITGLTGNIGDRIEENSSAITSNDDDIAVLVTAVSDNVNDITALQNLQPTETTDNVTFNSVDVDGGIKNGTNRIKTITVTGTTSSFGIASASVPSGSPLTAYCAFQNGGSYYNIDTFKSVPEAPIIRFSGTSVTCDFGSGGYAVSQNFIMFIQYAI